MDHEDHRFSFYSKKLIESADWDASSNRFGNLKEFPLMKGKQCVYVMDWFNSEVPFSRGVQEMLGYEPNEFKPALLTNFFHPDDKPILDKIIDGTMDHIISNGIDSLKLYHLMTYRIKKKNGDYIKVLRKSMEYEMDKDNKMISNLSHLTDISFISNNNKVEWDLYIPNLNIEKLRNDIRKHFVGFFSQRELEIINLINLGFSTKQMAERLFKSTHTISTHRKNILKKSNCHNFTELLSFCRQNGIL